MVKDRQHISPSCKNYGVYCISFERGSWGSDGESFQKMNSQVGEQRDSLPRRRKAELSHAMKGDNFDIFSTFLMTQIK